MGMREDRREGRGRHWTMNAVLAVEEVDAWLVSHRNLQVSSNRVDSTDSSVERPILRPSASF